MRAWGCHNNEIRSFFFGMTVNGCFVGNFAKTIKVSGAEWKKISMIVNVIL